MKAPSVYIILALTLITSLALWYNAGKVTPHKNSSSLDTIIVGTNAEFQPFTFKEENEIVGFDIDVMNEIFNRLGKKTILKDMPFDALVPEIQLGNIHIIAAGITPTQDRAKQALFARPHLNGSPLVIISLKTGVPINSFNELAGKTVTVNEGYSADTYMSQQPHISIIRLSSPAVSDGILTLQSGRADAYITALHPIMPYFDKYGDKDFVITPIPGTEESSAFAISKYYPELRDAIQITLDRMEADGTLSLLKKKWNLS